MQTEKLTNAYDTRMILIDDDPTYCAIMRRIAARKKIDLDIFPSIMDVSASADEIHGAYTAAIIDFDLGQVNGVEITGYLGSLLGEVPMILVSSTDRSEVAKQAEGRIVAFFNKASGFESILDKAELVCHQKRHAS